jgi:hypothetical protein
VHSFDFEGKEYIARFDWKCGECYIFEHAFDAFTQANYKLIIIVEDLQEFGNRGILKEHLDEWCIKQITEEEE